jgi:soluble lytic murein transglycosylase-like protein
MMKRDVGYLVLCFILILLFIFACYFAGASIGLSTPEVEAPQPQPQPQAQHGFDKETLEALDALIKSLEQLEQELRKYNDLSNRTGLSEVILACIKAEATRNGFAPSESLGKIQLESQFNPDSVGLNKNSSGKIISADIGLWQINSKTAPWLWAKVFPGIDYIADYEVAEGIFIDSRLFDPVVNTKLGSWFHGYLLKQYAGDRERAHTAYNRGEGGLEKWMASRGTARSPYSAKVIHLSNQWKGVNDL